MSLSPMERYERNQEHAPRDPMAGERDRAIARYEFWSSADKAGGKGEKARGAGRPPGPSARKLNGEQGIAAERRHSG